MWTRVSDIRYGPYLAPYLTHIRTQYDPYPTHYYSRPPLPIQFHPGFPTGPFHFHPGMMYPGQVRP